MVLLFIYLILLFDIIRYCLVISNCHFHLDSTLRLIIHQLKITELILLQLSLLIFNLQNRKSIRMSFNLLLQRLNMILIHMRISHKMHKIPSLIPTLLFSTVKTKKPYQRNQLCKQSIRGNIKRHS